MKVYLEFLWQNTRMTLSLDDVQYLCDELSFEELTDINSRLQKQVKIMQDLRFGRMQLFAPL